MKTEEIMKLADAYAEATEDYRSLEFPLSDDKDAKDAARAALVQELERFAAVVREAVIAELVAGSGKPALWHDPETGHWKKLTKPDRPTYEGFYTADQLAGAVTRERERIAKMVEEYETEHDITATWLNIVAAAIRGSHERNRRSDKRA